MILAHLYPLTIFSGLAEGSPAATATLNATLAPSEAVPTCSCSPTQQGIFWAGQKSGTIRMLSEEDSVIISYPP